MSDGYVNSRVVLFDKEGIYVRHWGKKGKGDGEFDLSHDVVVDPKGTVYVADRTNAQILGVLGSYGKVQGKFDFTHNMAVNSTGSIYAEIKNWRVQKFSPR